MAMSRASLILAVVVGVSAVSAISVSGQQIRTPRQTPFPQDPDFGQLEVETLHVQGNIYLVAGAGANIAVSVPDPMLDPAEYGERGVLFVDAGYAEMSDKVLAAARELSSEPVRHIINTTLADDHTGGNGELVAAGFLNQAGPGMGGRPNEGDLIGHGDLLRLMTEIGEESISTDRWPPSTYYGKQKDLYFNAEPVIILHVPDATTSGDSLVWFRGSDVLVTGEIFNQTSFPHIDVAHGGTINGVIDGLNTLLEIIVPRHLQEGGTMVIPAHGRISDEHDVLEYRDMVTIIRDRVQHGIGTGMTLDQIQAADYTYEYRPRFNRDPGWTSEMFVEAIYQTLQVPGSSN